MPDMSVSVFPKQKNIRLSVRNPLEIILFFLFLLHFTNLCACLVLCYGKQCYEMHTYGPDASFLLFTEHTLMSIIC